jgi:DNA-binding NarL/FixJ family response regulator
VRAQRGIVVVADADQGARQLAAGTLRRAGYETVEVETGGEALVAARAADVALLVLEVELPDITGYEVCHGLRQELGDAVAIIFVSGSHTDPMNRIAALLLGADDFIIKPFDPSELIARVGRFVARRADGNGRNGSAAPAQTNLTRREREVLALLAGGAKQGKIANQLSISPRTVGAHIQNLFGKLAVNSRAQLVARAYVLGLVVRTPDQSSGSTLA